MYSSEPVTSADDLRERLNARFRGPLMTFFLRRVRDRAEAEDLTQEVLLRVLSVTDAQRIRRAESFIFKIAINLLRDRGRRNARRGGADFLPIEEALAGEIERELVEELSPERALAGEHTLAEVLLALEELGERTRSIFVLFRLENMKQKDIAALYGMGQSTVEKHIMRAVVHLAARFGRK